MKLHDIIFAIVLVFKQASSEKQDFAAMKYAVEGKPISLPCAYPNSAQYLSWQFHKNGTDFDKEIVQVFPGQMPTVFSPFNTPLGRTEINGGTLQINQVLIDDEGDYWCEIASVGVATVKSTKYPVHVYVTPQEPKVTSLRNNTLTEHQNATVARCTSHGGKPGSKITWMKGSLPMSVYDDTVYGVNAFKSYLTDADVDLKISDPTRQDHKRVFSCIIEHPAYEGKKKMLNYSINVMYHPINIRVWANLTSLHVYCEAESYPSSTYHWRMPGGLTGFTGPSLHVADLHDLPGNEHFECIADNGIPPNATIRVQVDELLYPEGKPGWLGLDWWIWGVIFGSILAVVLLIVLIVCCWKKRGKNSGNSKATKHTVPKKRPLAQSVEYTRKPQHPTTLQVEMRSRTPDGREDSFDSRTPSPMNEHKQALVGGVFSRSEEKVTLIPNEEMRRSRENMFADNRRSMHASREQLDMVASHIQTLNKSWDQLSKSRQALNEAQDELQQTSSDMHQSREQLYHSREALNHDDDRNYPYIDDGTARSNEYYPQQDDRYQAQGYRQPPPAYDGTYNSQNQGYGDQRGYGDQGRYDDQDGGGYGRQGYDSYRDDQYRNDYDQDSRYNSRGDDYRDGRQDYYQDDTYHQRDQYSAKRIV